MYVVRDKKSQEIVHINPAPLSQELEGADVYYEFDSKTMEIGRWEGSDLPEVFDIDEKGQIVEASAEPVETAFASLASQEGVELSPFQKIVGEGEEAEIVPKSVVELGSEGLVSRDEVYDLSLQRLQGEIVTQYRLHRTPSGYRLDDFSRERLVFSSIYRLLPNEDARKRQLLDAGLIFPDAQVDEMVEAMRQLQGGYQSAVTTVEQGYQQGKAVEEWAAVSLGGTFPDEEGNPTI